MKFSERYITDEQLKSQWNGVCRNSSSSVRTLMMGRLFMKLASERDIRFISSSLDDAVCQLRASFETQRKSWALTNRVNWCQMHLRIVWNSSHPPLKCKLLLITLLHSSKLATNSSAEWGELQFLFRYLKYFFHPNPPSDIFPSRFFKLFLVIRRVANHLASLWKRAASAEF